MPDSSPISIIKPRLCVDIKGPPVVSLEHDIISIRFNENLAQCNLLEVSVNNWGIGNNGVIGYKYSEGNLLHLGASISLYVGDFILAEGTIVTLAPSFPKGNPPTLMFTVDAKHPPQNTYQRVLRTAVALTYPAELVEFHPVLRNSENLSRPRIDATGMVEGGVPILTAGTALKISGVGISYSGEYLVTETTHTFDLQFGYWTRFACSTIYLESLPGSLL